MSTYEKRMRQRITAKTYIKAPTADDERFMRLALAEAEKAREIGEVPVGAVLVFDGEVISAAHNRCESGNSALLHAELETVRMACEAGKNWRLCNCTLYVTLEPCPMCAGAIINSHIARVVYGAKDASSGAFGSVINLNTYPLGFRPKLTAGVLYDECSEILRCFFAELRARRRGDRL